MASSQAQKYGLSFPPGWVKSLLVTRKRKPIEMGLSQDKEMNWHVLWKVKVWLDSGSDVSRNLFPLISHANFLYLAYILRWALSKHWLNLPTLSPVTTLDSHLASLEPQLKESISFPRVPAEILRSTLVGLSRVMCPFLNKSLLDKGMWCFDWPGLSHVPALWSGTGATSWKQSRVKTEEECPHKRNSEQFTRSNSPNIRGPWPFFLSIKPKG